MCRKEIQTDIRRCAGIGIQNRLKICWVETSYGFESRRRHHLVLIVFPPFDDKAERRLTVGQTTTLGIDCNGSKTDFDSVSRGSNPLSPATRFCISNG